MPSNTKGRGSSPPPPGRTLLPRDAAGRSKITAWAIYAFMCNAFNTLVTARLPAATEG